VSRRDSESRQRAGRLVVGPAAFQRQHRERPLDNHALEKSGQERPEGPKSCSEMAPLAVDFERKCARKPGPFREALTVEKKLAASLAVEAVTSEPLFTVNSLLTAKLTGNIAESGLNILLQER
jgi:hypothetical protein